MADHTPVQLTADLPTPIGYYPAGTHVIALNTDGHTASICVDNGWHPIGNCHMYSVAIERITPIPRPAMR